MVYTMGMNGEETQPKEPAKKKDVLTKEQRHKCMSRIKGRDTSIELALRKALWAKGYRYRKNFKGLPGRPDIVLTKQRVAIFCDGELFHGKDYFEVLKPRLLSGNNSDYWINKIERNMERDIENEKRLLRLGWTVIRFWGKDILKNTDECLKTIEETIFEKTMENDFTQSVGEDGEW